MDETQLFPGLDCRSGVFFWRNCMETSLGSKFLEIQLVSTEMIGTDNLMEDDSIVSVWTDKKKRNGKI